LEKFNGFIAATSCNISNHKDLTNFNDVRKYFDNKADMLIDGGDCKIKKASTIIRIVDNKIQIIREGSISASELIL
jgi:L-threonylcarbamoyladenylate synthase